MPDNDIDSVDNWSFPDVHHDSDVGDPENPFVEGFDMVESEAAAEIKDPALIAAEEAALVQAQAEDELNRLKQTYQDKIQQANTLIERLQGSVSQIDNQVVMLIQEIIQKITKKILYREIATSPELITNMIAELKKIVPAEATLVDVLVSPADFQQLCNENGEPLIPVTALDSLSAGDIVIRSNTTEIRAMLDERIDKLLETQHE